MESLGQLIRVRRKEQGLSQQVLADMCGTSDSEIAKIEHGERKTPNCQTLCKIAKALGYHPIEILLASGLLTEEDVKGMLAIQRLEQLNRSELSYVQGFVDFLIYRKTNTEKKLSELETTK